MITMRNLWGRVVTDCVCDRGVTSGTVVQLGVISVCNEHAQFQFGSALPGARRGMRLCGSVLVWRWFSRGSDAGLYRVALVSALVQLSVS